MKRCGAHRDCLNPKQDTASKETAACQCLARTVQDVKPCVNTSTHLEAADRLMSDGVALRVMDEAVVLFEDSNGYLHAEPRCWGASKIVRIDVVDFPDLPDPPRCECGGWKGSKAASALEEAGWMYAQIDGAIGTECTDLGRWLVVQAQPLRCADLAELHQRLQQITAGAVAQLRQSAKTRAAVEAIAAQAVRIAVTPEEGPGLRHWAQSMLLEHADARRNWLDNRFYQEFAEQLHNSPQVRAVLACRVGYGSAAILVQLVCSEVVERHDHWIGEGYVPELVIDGMAQMRGAGGKAVVLNDTDQPDVWRTAAKLWMPRGGERSDLHEVVELARAVHTSVRRD